MTKALPILAALALLGANGCPDATVRCPVTSNCPKGECVAVGSVDAEGHPGVSLVCKDPVFPPSPPMPTPTPTVAPSESPAPSPTPTPPVCRALPGTPCTGSRSNCWECSMWEPGAPECCIAWSFWPTSPTPPPSPEATPTPRPSSTPVPTCLGVPQGPVPIVYGSDQCPEGLIQHGRVPDGRRVCVAPTYCGLDNCPPDNCRSAFSAVRGLEVDADFYVSAGGFICDRNGGAPRPAWCADAYGRKYSGAEPGAGQQPFRQDANEDGPWRVLGNCRPKAADPCATPPPTPFPTPTPGPTAIPTATPMPGTVACADGRCPKAVAIRWGANTPVKKSRGYRNTGNVTPDVIGCCLHKGDTSPTARCAVDEGCGDAYATMHGGHLEAFQTGSNWSGRESVEYQSNSAFTIVDATNSDIDEHWAGSEAQGWTYLLAGSRTFCVSLSYLSEWACRNLTMSRDGKWEGISDRYEMAKTAARSIMGLMSRGPEPEVSLRPLLEGSPEALAARRRLAVRIRR